MAQEQGRQMPVFGVGSFLARVLATELWKQAIREHAEGYFLQSLGKEDENPSSVLHAYKDRFLLRVLFVTATSSNF